MSGELPFAVRSVPDPITGGAVGPTVDPTPASRPDRATSLDGRFVSLVPLDPAAHANSLYEDTCGPGNEELWLYLGIEPPADEASFRAYLDKAASGDDPFFYAILDKASGKAVGHATLMRIEPAQRVIEVGNILYGRRLQRTPGATEAMYLMARHAFEVLGYRRYEWKCNALNAPSRRAARRYGFAFEGLFRQHMIVKGRNRDTSWFSMLDREWPARKLAFARWLDPANFDDMGRQRFSLDALNATDFASDDLVLRRAGPDDEQRFGDLQASAYAWNREMLGREPLPLLVPTSEVLAQYETWLVEDQSGLAGAIALEPNPDHLLIWSVSTDPARQNSGLGRKLLAAAETRARALGLSTIRLYTGAPLTKNIDWYGRRGYATERIEDLPDRQVVHMIKQI